MKVKLYDFKREEHPLPVSGGKKVMDWLELTVFAKDGKSYQVIETFLFPGAKLRNIQIIDTRLDRGVGLVSKGYELTIVNLNDLVIANKKRTDPSVLKYIATRLLNAYNELVRDDAEMYYNHIIAILKFLEDFHEGERQIKLMDVDDDVGRIWAPALRRL